MTAPRTISGVTLWQSFALVPTCIVVGSADVGLFAVQLIAAIATAIGWEALFALARHRGFSLHGLTTALIIVVLFPPDLAIWELVLILSLGVTLGELVFGGRGFGFVQPATVAAALLLFSFPQSALTPPSQAVALATLPGAAILIGLQLISWRIIFGAFAGLAVCIALTGQAIDAVSVGAAMAFSLVFLICDPFAAAATNPGRWIYGVLAGSLIALFADGAVPTTQAMVFAAMLASLTAPLIDHLVVLVHARLRRLRHV
ncbi:RnfABCDGE type electron transport complex subunit D [uncultured Sulfitobacter sp.]|uniref:RnfABCDGE type electron transport complex subunit D n=1 Tax=uncultured Sulfitobacter sp. TaxID=191468 RepID=UPI00260C28A1|nr:RnfABCDGE type electron transport complex subunit D [uncultured Sulfitobacter sp.]